MSNPGSPVPHFRGALRVGDFSFATERMPQVPPTLPEDGKPGTGEDGNGTPPGAGEKKRGHFRMAMDAIVEKERADAAKVIVAKDAEITTLREQLAAKTTEKDETYAESIRKPLVEKLSAIEAREKLRGDKLKRSELKAAAKGLAVEGAEDDVADALLPSLTLNDADELEVVEVVDGATRRKYGADGAMTPKELVTEYLRKKTHLALPSVRAGLGLGTTPPDVRTGTAKIDALRADIATAEAKKDFGTAGRLKSELLDALNSKK